MNKIKKLMSKFSELPASKKVQLVIAMTLTAGLVIAIPTYAWFTSQKKAAEMYKVEYPNSLYLNAAHREDQINFDLGAVNINEYRKNEAGNWLDVNGNVVDNKENAAKITSQRYIFSVSGSNTNSYILQMAHTTNNEFTYTIYKAKQYKYPKGTSPNDGTNGEPVIKEKDIVPSNTPDDDILIYKMHPNSHSENTMSAVGDDVIDDTSDDLIYYVKLGTFTGENDGYKNDADTDSLGDSDPDPIYISNFGDNSNVQENAVALYWQGTNYIPREDIDANKKFCDHYILEVTWPGRDSTVLSKESDMVYLTVKRNS